MYLALKILSALIFLTLVENLSLACAWVYVENTHQGRLNMSHLYHKHFPFWISTKIYWYRMFVVEHNIQSDNGADIFSSEDIYCIFMYRHIHLLIAFKHIVKMRRKDNGKHNIHISVKMYTQTSAENSMKAIYIVLLFNQHCDRGIWHNLLSLIPWITTMSLLTCLSNQY